MTSNRRLAAAGLATALTLTPVVGLATSYLGASVAQAAPSASAAPSTSAAASSSPESSTSAAASSSATCLKAGAQAKSAPLGAKLKLKTLSATASKATAPKPSQAAANAAWWLGTQLTDGKYYTSPYTGKADVGLTADVLIGLVAGGNNPAAEKVNSWLKDNAQKATSLGQIAKVAIAAEAMGDDPSNYNGHDLIAPLWRDECTDGSASLGDPYSDSLALIAIKSVSVDVPSGLVEALVKQQNASGEFFFSGEDGSKFADPDTTGLAIQALDGIGGADASAALTKAVAWATKHETSGGYWTSAGGSDVNTTALIGSALNEQGKSVSKSISWMIAQQTKAGGKGLPASLSAPKDPDVMATAQGILLLAGVSLNTVALGDQSTPSTPTSSSTPSHPASSATSKPSSSTTASNPPLPATGGPASGSGASDLGVISLGIVAVGLMSGAVALRARRRV